MFVPKSHIISQKQHVIALFLSFSHQHAATTKLGIFHNIWYLKFVRWVWKFLQANAKQLQVSFSQQSNLQHGVAISCCHHNTLPSLLHYFYKTPRVWQMNRTEHASKPSAHTNTPKYTLNKYSHILTHIHDNTHTHTLICHTWRLHTGT